MSPTDYPVSFSHLKQFAHSPAHYLHSLTNGITESAAMRIGKLVHCAVLGGEFVVYGETRRGKDWEAFKSTNRGKFIVSDTEVENASSIVDAIQANSLAMSVLAGRHELEIDWNIGPRKCQSHLDVLADTFISDLKITNCTEPSRFSAQAERMAWHAQLAWYRKAVYETKQNDIRDLYLVGVEPKAPYNVTVLRMPMAAIQDGDILCRKWFEQLIACESSGVFPGYTDRVFDMELRGLKQEQEES